MPLIVYFHGGGFVYGDLRGGDWICGTVAKELDAVVVSSIVIVGGHDPLHDDGTLYAAKLLEAGVTVQLLDYPSMPHGFINFPRFARDAKPAKAAVVASQRRALAL